MTDHARALGQPALKRVNVEPGHHAFGAIANLSIQIWWAGAREADALYLLGTGDVLVEAYPRGFGSIHLCKGGTGLPDRGARTHFETALERYGEAVGDIGVVFEGNGFWVSALRSFMAGLKMAVGPSAQFRVYPSLMELLATLPEAHQQRTGVEVTRQELDAAIRHLCELAERSL